MGKKICFATGSMYRWAKDPNKLIGYIGDLKGIDGIELTLGRNSGGKDIILGDESIRILKRHGPNSLHSPFRFVFKNNKKSYEMARSLVALARMIDAKRIIFHPHKVREYEPIFNIEHEGIDMCIENMTINSREDMARYIGRILEKHKGLKLCLDTSHSTTFTPNMTEELVKDWSERIAQVHLSANVRGYLHRPLCKAKEGFFSDTSIIKELDVPFVIEEDFARKDLMLVQREIDFVRKWSV